MNIPFLTPANLIFILMGLVVIWVFTLFSSHKIAIKKMYKVTDGTIIKSGRYRLVVDKKQDLEYLKPMFGKEWLPVAPSAAFQKVNSVPFIGASRIATYCYVRSLPSSYLLPDGTQEKLKIRRWVYMRERHKLHKLERREKFLSFIGTYAGILIVVCTLGFFIFMIFTELKNDHLVAAKLEELYNYAAHMLQNG